MTGVKATGPHEDSRAIALARGKLPSEIAKDEGVTVNTIKGWRDRRLVSPINEHQEDLRDLMVLERADRGEKPEEIAQRYNMTVGQVCSLIQEAGPCE